MTTEDRTEKEVNWTLEPLSERHGAAVVEIFNYYIGHGDAAFFERPLPPTMAERLLAMSGGLPAWAAVAEDGRVAGFAALRPHSPLPTFAHVAELTCFLRPDFCRMGLGSALLARLLADGGAKGIASVLASVAETNAASLLFHLKHGFAACGRLRGALRKNGRDLDVVLLQKSLAASVQPAVRPPEPQRFARAWIEDWNSHDLARILAHYAEDVEVTTPMIRRLLGLDVDTLCGKAAVGEYWRVALQRVPDLRFELLDVAEGVGAIALYYRSSMGRRVVETMTFDAMGKVARMTALYTALGAFPVH